MYKTCVRMEHVGDRDSSHKYTVRYRQQAFDETKEDTGNKTDKTSHRSDHTVNENMIMELTFD